MTACKKRWLLKHCVQYASTSLHPVYISVFVSRYVVGGFVTVLYLGYLSLFHVMLSGVLQLYFTLVICLCFTLCCQRFCRCTLLWLSVFVSRYAVRGFVAVLYFGYRSLLHVMLSEVLQLYFTLVICLCFTLCCQRFCSCTLPWLSVFVSRYVVRGFVAVLYFGYRSLFHVMLSEVLQLYFTLVIGLCFTLCCQRFCSCTLLWLSVFVSRYAVRGFVAVLYLGTCSLVVSRYVVGGFVAVLYLGICSLVVFASGYYFLLKILSYMNHQRVL